MIIHDHIGVEEPQAITLVLGFGALQGTSDVIKVANPCLSNGAGKRRSSPRAPAQETQFQMRVRSNGGSTADGSA